MRERGRERESERERERERERESEREREKAREISIFHGIVCKEGKTSSCVINE